MGQAISNNKISTPQFLGIFMGSVFTFGVLQLGLLLDIPDGRNYFLVICGLCIIAIGFAHFRFLLNLLDYTCFKILNNREKYSHILKMDREMWSMPFVFLALSVTFSIALFQTEWLTFDSTWIFMFRNSIVLFFIGAFCYFSYSTLNTTEIDKNDVNTNYGKEFDSRVSCQIENYKYDKIVDSLTKRGFLLAPSLTLFKLKEYNGEAIEIDEKIIWCDVVGCKNNSREKGNTQTLILFINQIFNIKPTNKSHFSVDQQRLISDIAQSFFIAKDQTLIVLEKHHFDHSVKRTSKRIEELNSLLKSINMDDVVNGAKDI